jgi:cytosine/adenosine deaminase-related metal-dependent hydrolase
MTMTMPEVEPADVMIRGAMIVTMDAQRRIITDGAVAFRGDRIIAVGKRADVEPRIAAAEIIDGRRFVITPGYINGHVHITGEPLTRGLVPDSAAWRANVFDWLIPLHRADTEAGERLSAQLAAAELLRNGVTTFLEAATVSSLDVVIDGVREIGIRARIGQRAQDRMPNAPMSQAAMTDAAIKVLQAEMERFPVSGRALVGAWPGLVGHITATDALWRAAADLAREHGAGVTAHMSPDEEDPDWYLAHVGRRPVQHLAEIGVLSERVSLTHANHLDDAEVDCLAQTGANITHCPATALKGSYGTTGCGKFPEMAAQGVNIMLGTDGANNNNNSGDLARCMWLMAGLFKDARRDSSLFPAHEALEMVTLNGAKALGLADQIGSIEVGKKADIVLHDIDRPEWRPLLNVVNQLVWSADGRGVHTVFVDGVKVVDNYRCTRIDEDALYAQAEEEGRALAHRAGLWDAGPWPIV